MDISTQVRALVATTLKVPPERITASTGSGDIGAWDSLGQVNIIMALEQTFDVYIEPEDFVSLSSVSSIVDFLKGRGIG